MSAIGNAGWSPRSALGLRISERARALIGQLVFALITILFISLVIFMAVNLDQSATSVAEQAMQLASAGTAISALGLEATPAGATWRDVLVFRDYGTTELPTPLVRCADHRDPHSNGTARVTSPRRGTAPSDSRRVRSRALTNHGQCRD